MNFMSSYSLQQKGRSPYAATNHEGCGGEGAVRGPESSPSEGGVLAREHMFDKVVTPSDVGKLNRLVIPKQHAEKYFPLDSSANEKGLLLNFEDRNGKPWRFRYSYWNSSQSYVMTKGWSRFVKEKRLDAGDTVSFQRGVGDAGKDRLFIDWRRRPDAPELYSISLHRQLHPWGPFFPRDYSHLPQANAASMAAHHQSYYNTYGVVTGNPSILYLRSAHAAEGGGGGGAIGSQRGGANAKVEPVVHGKAAAKRLRLFGVNMDCPVSPSDEYDMMSFSPTIATGFPLLHQPPGPATNFDSSPSSSSFQCDLQLRPCYSKGKGSLDLDI